jgi:hypothetical protein
VLRDAGREHRVLEAPEPSALTEVARDVVRRALERSGEVVAAGGDGTIDAVAQQVLGSSRSLGPPLQGTLDHFGRAHGVPPYGGLRLLWLALRGAPVAARGRGRHHAAMPDPLRLVVTHRPVPTVGAQAARDRLHGAEPAVRRWVEAGADRVLGGHIHLLHVARLHGSIDGLAPCAWAVQAGTAVSHRVRHEAGNSVNLIRGRAQAAPRRCVVERGDFDAAARAFARVASHALGLDALPPCVVSEATA